MKKATLCAVAALAVSLGSSAQQQLPAGTLRVDVVEIMDTAGFGRPMVAARALVPSGWRAQGGVQWAARPCQEPATFAWQAVAPDGSQGIELFPAQTWAAGSSGPGDCTAGEFRSMREYLEAYVRGRVPGARVLDYRPRADFIDTNRAYYDGMIQVVSQSGTGIRAWADAGEVLYAFQQGGVEMRGVASAAGMFYSSELANPLGGAPLWTLTGGTNGGVFGAYAPNGQLDFAKIEALRKSVKPDAGWLAELFKVKLAIGAENVRATRERAAIIVAGGAAMTQATIQANQMATRNYADVTSGSGSSSTSATDDRMQRERIEAIRGVETYHDVIDGGTVELDATYDHAWRVQNQQSYILTNDPNFNPGLYDIDARQLAVVQ